MKQRLRALLERPFVGLALAVLGAYLWSSALLWLRPENVFDDDFVIFEPGHNLLLVDQLLAGKRLYRDVFSQYGPLPAYAQAAWAWCFGNTAHTYVGLTQLLTLVNVGLLYQLLRRSVSAPTALGWIVAAVLPFILLPGSFAAGEIGVMYPGFERIFLLLIALSWVDPRVRSHRRALVLGLLLGGMQLVKFGGAAMAGGALLITDLLFLWRALADPAARRRHLGMMGCILGGFLALESLWAAAAFLTLPAAIARDVLWPAYMLKNYASYRTTAPRYVSWLGAKYFIELQLPVAMAAALNALLIRRVLARPDGQPGALVFCACYFPLAVAFYLPHMWVASASAWIFLAAGVYVFSGLRLPVRAAVLLGLFPCFYVSLKSVGVKGERANARDVTMPNGEHLWLTPEWQDIFTRVRAVVDPLAPRPALLIFTIGSGWYHYFPYEHWTRHTFMMAGFTRPAEEPALVASLSRTAAVVVFARQGGAASLRPDPGTWPVGLNPFFSPEVNAAFARQLGEPVPIGDRCTVFPVRH